MTKGKELGKLVEKIKEMASTSETKEALLVGLMEGNLTATRDGNTYHLVYKGQRIANLSKAIDLNKIGKTPIVEMSGALPVLKPRKRTEDEAD